MKLGGNGWVLNMNSLRDDMPEVNPYIPRRDRGRVVRPSGTAHIPLTRWAVPVMITEEESFGHYESIPSKRINEVSPSCAVRANMAAT